MIVIERAKPDQVNELVDLFAGYLHFYKKPADPGAIRDFLAQRLQREQSVIFLARQNDAPVGFVQLYPAFNSLSLKPNWILNDLYVAEHARRAGVALLLMNAARGLAEQTGACELFLQTARDNRSAQRLYEQLGYERDDEFLVYMLSL